MILPLLVQTLGTGNGLKHGSERQTSSIDVNISVVSNSVICFLSQNSGALKVKVPTLLLMAEVSESGSKILDKPISPSLMTISRLLVEVTKMFLGFMSL